MSLRWSLVLSVVAGVCALSPRGACAIENSPGASELAAFIDPIVERQMRERSVPGAAVIVASDRGIVFARSYGFADVERREQIDIERTVFPVGSISKPITAVAVMQLWERGLLRLDADVNGYLDAPLDCSRPGDPVTLHQLLTHTAGYDPVMLAIGARSPGELLTLKRFVIDHEPPRSNGGRFINYSNYDYALAGRVVERVAGIDFATYMRTRVLDPLGMSRSTFQQDARVDRLANGYDLVGRSLAPVRPLLLHGIPASGLRATAGDIGRFMSWQLGGSARSAILKPETLSFMQRRQFTHHPLLPGWTYGLAERGNDDGLRCRVLEHGGVWSGFTCKLMLIPEHRAGLFVIYNRYDPRLLDELSKALLVRFYRDEVESRASAPVMTVTAKRDDLDRFVGDYRMAGYSHNTFEKLRVLWKPCTRIARSAKEPWFLEMARPGQGRTRLVATNDPLLFERNGSGQPVAFALDERGRVELLFTGSQAMERCQWWETPPVQVLLFVSFATVFAVAAITFAVRIAFAIARQCRGMQRRETSNFACRWLAIASTLANLAFLGALLVMLFASDQRQYLFGLPVMLKLMLRLPLPAGAVAGMLLLSALATRSPVMSPARRARYALFACLACAFVPFLAYWNLI